MYVEVVVNVPQLTTSFQYAVPPWLRERLAVGHLVVVPFGKQKVQGVVVSLTEEPEVEAVRPVLGCVDRQPVLNPAQIDLAYWLSHRYLAPLVDCLTLMLPPGLSKHADTLYRLAAHGPTPNDPGQADLVRLLEKRGPMRGRQLAGAFPDLDWRRAANALVRLGILHREGVLDPPSIHPKHSRLARLVASPQEVQAAVARLSQVRRGARAARLAAVLDFLIAEGKPVEVSWIYAETGANYSDLKLLAEEGLIAFVEAEVWRDPLAQSEFGPYDPPPLTPDQDAVLRTILKGFRDLGGQAKPPTYLLHGVTGSGKTEVYLRTIAAILERKRQAIVLVPEIALTPQTVRRFAGRFPGRVAVLHSDLSDGERYDTWRRARLGLIDILIGPRSALFAPLPDIGLIVVDEEHDQAYKQDVSTGLPYHAVQAAVEYARRLNAVCILGSATPDLVSSYRADRGEYCRLHLPERIMGHGQPPDESPSRRRVDSKHRAGPSKSHTIEMPPVEIVDMRAELRAGNRSIFSRSLQEALTEVLERGEQAILFLNRRGTASYVFCRDCGFVLRCPRCEDMPLTYHRQGEQLICHHCNFRRPHPQRCPQCESVRIRHFGIGTEKVELEAQRLFAQARPLRWDWDSTRYKGAHEAILKQFAAGEANVLVGTQMIAKGLDLPLVTLVGVVSADVGLGLPDFRAAERTFQVLTQVAGRAGRGPRGGRVILQSYDPSHYVIQAAAGHDYAAFYRLELQHRRELRYPPFRQLVRLLYSDPDAQRAEREALTLARQLQNLIKKENRTNTELIGPAPSFFGKVGGEYRWQILLRGPSPCDLLRDSSRRAPGWQVDVDPVSTL